MDVKYYKKGDGVIMVSGETKVEGATEIKKAEFDKLAAKFADEQEAKYEVKPTKK